MHRAKSMLIRLQRPESPMIDSQYDVFPRRSRLLSLESLMSFGMGSDPNGGTLSGVMCANQSGWMHGYKGCMEPGLMSCAGCYLVKYCSERCQKQHWPRHRTACNHLYLKHDWQPAWILEKRKPRFRSTDVSTEHLWGDVPAIDILRLDFNEGDQALSQNFKLCFAASGDIRNLVETVNGLPKHYQGKCDILLNDINPIVLATHLMYSAALPAAGASFLQRCIDYVYGSNSDRKYLTVLSSPLEAQGRFPRYRRLRASSILWRCSGLLTTFRPQASNLDDHDRLFSKLTPGHRLAIKRFRETGVLAPFSLNTNTFMHPNRFAIGCTSGTANPLCGWDMSAVQLSGEKHGVEFADIFGCLFFHVKDQLREFARRMKDFNIHLHLTQFDAKILSKGLFAGVVPAFGGPCFDRVDASNTMDSAGIKACLNDWGPLLNRQNERSAILIHSKAWHTGRRDGSAQAHPRTVEWLMKKYCNIPGLPKPNSLFNQGLRSPLLLHMIESVDAFYDHEPAFRRYLQEHDMDVTTAALGLRHREAHTIHPKRFGVTLGPTGQRLPDLSKDEFYRLFTLGNANLLVRFLEFENTKA
ncbi:hypothetical protein EDD18DRAFT_1162060 [Armillaria luteobubalina]|uniref:MYND-type domain-containing protein n=1 Tax=Armillaria luteobubalina TaxID=153913 RepID=A0AA39Q6Y0_9AGAR|nr:hypothetical protein EDD18DRAFT_1162060 [Armillaria luteobubalina]